MLNQLSLTLKMDAAASHIEKMNANPIYNGAQAYGTYYATPLTYANLQ